MRTLRIIATGLLAGALASSSLSAASAKSVHRIARRPALDATTSFNLKVNPLLQPWTGPYGGEPAFDHMSLIDLKPALEAGIAAHLAQLDDIAANPAPPTFANTIEAMERAGRPLERAMVYYNIWASNLSSPEFRKLQSDLAPRLAAYNAEITQNPKLFARIDALESKAAHLKLTPAMRRLTFLVWQRFKLNGATLAGAAKARFAAINKELAQAQTTFADNLLADEEGWTTYLTPTQLGGLPAAFVKSAAAEAAARGKPDLYAVTNTRSSIDPFLTYSTERSLREAVWRNFYNRGDNGDAHDNNAVIVDILKLRNERARLLGYPTYAAWRLAPNMAKTPEAAIGLMRAVLPAALARVREEVADMQAIADTQSPKITIEPWDYRFYMEKVREARYDLNSEDVRAYLQLDKLREAMFYVAGALFGFDFTPVPNGAIPVFHPDVKVWEVSDRTTHSHVGYWYLDPFARTGKRSGAWTTSYRSHASFSGLEQPLGANNSNFVKPAPGEPVLVSLDDARTFFHEFGHALHAFSSQVAYPTLNGGVRDYTEFHSQLLEHWLLTDNVITTYLTHYQTGQPMPAALVAKIKKSETFMQGFNTVEFLGSAIMDMRYHMIDPAGLNPQEFEKQELAKLGMPREIPMRHRSTQFGHVFSNEGYAAGYYGYLWADVLTADAAEAFAEAPGGYYDKPLARKMIADLFSVRNSVDPSEAYRDFRGRNASVDALMRYRGFPVSHAGSDASQRPTREPARPEDGRP